MNSSNIGQFADLFKKYRLRSEIETLSQFGDLLAQEGLVYENSLFTHWQKGDRVPKDRKLLLKIVTIFIKRHSIQSIFEANTFMAAANVRDLSDAEIEMLQGLFVKYKVKHEKEEQAELSSLRQITQVALYPSAASLITGYFVSILILWIYIAIFGLKNTHVNLFFNLVYSLMPIFAGILSLCYSRKWGFFASSMGKAITFLSLGLISWGTGGLIWAWYNFFQGIEVPYPSLADVGYILSWPLWGLGIYYLSLVAGIKRNIHTPSARKQILLIPVISVAISYYLQVIVARGGHFASSSEIYKVVFDLAYPLLDSLIIVEAALIYGLSFRFIKGQYRWPLYVILSGIVTNYFADFFFAYATTKGVFYNGAPGDMLFALAMYLLSIGILSLNRQ